MKENKLAVIILGAPASGKGTQSDILEENTNFKKYVMSDLIKKSAGLDLKIKEKMEKGILVSDLDIFKIFRENFKLENNVILDGVSRSIDQAYWFYGFFKTHGYDIKVVYLEIDEEKLVKRVLKRAKIEKRLDDTEDIFKERMRQYDTAKNIVLKVFKDVIIKVNGDRSVDDISKDIFDKLNLN